MIYYTLLICDCGDDKTLLLWIDWDPEGVPVVVRVFDVEPNNPCSWLLTFALFAAAFEVDVILQTDTAFLRYFASRRVVPFVIPTS